MELEALLGELSPDQISFQLGCSGVDALTGAFPRKRVVHAGLQGRLIPGDEIQEIWRQLMEKRSLKRQGQAAYIHIPFCKTKCLYCGFFQNSMEQEKEDHYIDCLLRELQDAAVNPRVQDGLIHSIFIGGGTPTSLSAANAARLLKAIHESLPLANDCELTLEGRVHDLIPEKMDIWLANGVNRMSLGVQSFHTKIRRQVGRIDPQKVVMQRLRELASYQQCSVVIDLMYGLPDQSLSVWEEDLELLLEAAVDGVDFYQLNVFNGSDLNRRIQAGILSPAATTVQQAQMYAMAHDFMKKRGFNRLSTCHWSRSNRERSLYNTMAKQGVTLFPFGCGAGGNVDGYSMKLYHSLQPYEKMVASGNKPIMALLQKTRIEPLINMTLAQLERGFFDLVQIVTIEERLKGLKWLYDLWEERGLVRHNGVLYKLTVAGQFWQVNLAQTTVECIQLLLTGKNTLAVQKIAAQDAGL